MLWCPCLCHGLWKRTSIFIPIYIIVSFMWPSLLVCGAINPLHSFPIYIILAALHIYSGSKWEELGCDQEHGHFFV